MKQATGRAVRALTCLSLAAMLSLAGCAPKQEPSPSPSATPVVVTASATPEPSATAQPAAEPTDAPFTGNPITGDPDWSGAFKPVLCVFDMASGALPQAGISQADVLYQVQVEGGETRMLGLFLTDIPEKAGPVRSARTVFVSIQQMWGCLFVHHGGATNDFLQEVDAYGQLKTYQVERFDGMSDGAYFWRGSEHKAPHNSYANLQKCLADSQGAPEARGFVFGELPQGGAAAQQIDFAYSSLAREHYDYDADQGLYLRQHNGKKLVDAENSQQVAASNVIMIKYPFHDNVDSSHHGYYEMTGQGEAVICRDGRSFPCTWIQENKTDMIRFVDDQGNDIPLKVGKSCVHILPDKVEITCN